MDYYRKKFKPSRPPNSDNPVDLEDVESKWLDMQPRIHECAGDKTKVQKQLSEIRSYIEYCQRMEEQVSEDQRERIRTITRKCKEVLAKYGNINEINTGSVKSPRPIRKIASVDTSEQVLPQNKVALVEVEQKLKSMRQKRLDRLSLFVAEQSKLSEERSSNGNENNEIENAIKSMQQIGPEKKPSFKSIIEEDLPEKERANEGTIRRHSSESSDKSKPSSTRKFINKFNCSATSAVGSSNEDLTKEDDDKNSRVGYLPSANAKTEIVGEKNNFNRSSFQKDKEPKDKNNVTETEAEKFSAFNRSSLRRSAEIVKDKGLRRSTDAEEYNPLLSPVGKQRRAIYLYDNECKFLENERQPSMFAGNNNQEQPVRKLDIKPKGIGHTYENRDIIAKHDSEKTQVVLTTFGKTTQEKLTVEPKGKPSQIYENRAIIEKKSEVVLTTFGKNNNEDHGGKAEALDESNTQKVSGKKDDVETKATVSQVSEGKTTTVINSYVGTSEPHKQRIDNGSKVARLHEIKPKKSNSLAKLIIKNEVTANRKSMENMHVPRSPVPSPRRTNNGERVLKKLQRNWDSLNDIIENDSDVDCDEIEDLRKTWEEANTLLDQYKARIDKLERKSQDRETSEKLSEIKKQLRDVREGVERFRGLRRDSSYKQLSSRLSNYFLVVNKLSSSKIEVLNEKRAVISDIETYIKLLESKVNRNEAVLIEILEDQVKTIGTKYLHITSV